jgi:hypothetical protein
VGVSGAGYDRARTREGEITFASQSSAFVTSSLLGQRDHPRQTFVDLRRVTLIVLALDPSVVQSSRLSEVVGEIRTRMAEDLAAVGLKAELSGVP